MMDNLSHPPVKSSFPLHPLRTIAISGGADADFGWSRVVVQSSGRRAIKLGSKLETKGRQRWLPTRQPQRQFQ